MPQEPNIYSFDVSRASPTASYTDTQREIRDAEILRGEETARLIKAGITAVKRLFTGSANAKTRTVTAHSHPDETKLAA